MSLIVSRFVPGVKILGLVFSGVGGFVKGQLGNTNFWVPTEMCRRWMVRNKPWRSWRPGWRAPLTPALLPRKAGGEGSQIGDFAATLEGSR